MFHLFLRRVLLYLGFLYGLGEELQSCSHYEKLVKSAWQTNSPKKKKKKGQVIIKKDHKILSLDLRILVILKKFVYSYK